MVRLCHFDGKQPAFAAEKRETSFNTLKGRVVQTGEGWNAGVNPKAMGGHNLDAATRQLPELEHFVMFSSIVASAGNEGTHLGLPAS